MHPQPIPRAVWTGQSHQVNRVLLRTARSWKRVNIRWIQRLPQGTNKTRSAEKSLSRTGREGEFPDEVRGVHRADPRARLQPGRSGEATYRVLVSALVQCHRVIARPDVDDAGGTLGRQPVQGRVDQAEGMPRHLVGQCDDAREQRVASLCRRPGTSPPARRRRCRRCLPTGCRPRSGDVRRARRGGHRPRSVRRRDTTAGRTGPTRRRRRPRFRARVAVEELAHRLVVAVRRHGRRGGLALRAEVQFRAADRRHEGVAARPRGHRGRIVGGLVELDAGGAGIARGGEHRDVVPCRELVGAAQRLDTAMPGKVCSVALKLWLITSPRWCRARTSRPRRSAGSRARPRFPMAFLTAQQDAGAGAVAVLHVQRGLARPADPCWSCPGRGGGHLAAVLDHPEPRAGRRPRSRHVERLIVGEPKGVDDDDRVPLPVMLLA